MSDAIDDVGRAILNRLAATIADGLPLGAAEEANVRATSGRASELHRIAAIRDVFWAADLNRTLPVGRSTDPASNEPEVADESVGEWGPLTLVRQLGVGSNGEVYLARDRNLDRLVALKLLHQGATRTGDPRRVLHEARRLAKVHHPNVVTVHWADEHDDRLGVWMEYIEGQTLEEMLSTHGRMGADEATTIGLQLTPALAAVHAAGLVHRDVKTTNIMRASGGRIVLMDFSEAAELDPITDSAIHVSPAGTAAYMAPELFRGEGASIATDVYALGVVLYRLVTGAFPAPATTLGELRQRHREQRYVRLRDERPDLPQQFVDAVETALDPNPQVRFSGMGDFERALRPHDSVTRGASEVKTRSLSRWMWGVAAAVVLAVAGMLLPRLLSKDLRVDAALFRAVDEVDERVLDGTPLTVGDRLFLELQGSREMYVYVFNEDDAGRSYVLFPGELYDLSNPIEGGKRVSLPGSIDGQPFTWDVTSAAGAEFIYVVASSTRLDELETRLGEWLETGRTTGLPRDALAPLLRGIGGLRPAPDRKEESEAAMSSAFEELEARAAEDGDLWVKRFRLGASGP